MRFPDVLSALADQGIIDEVLRPLKSGKEAEVFLVVAGGVERVAKVYKQASHRSFKNRSIYEEGRRVRSSRDQRAMERRSRHGRAEQEQAWKSSEADAIFRLHAHGVRVPEPHHFIDGVLLMELVRGPGGLPAPRLAELSLGRDEAHAIFGQLLGEVVKMLCAGIVHGDLSDYNVLLDAAGPVVIDFPQAVDAAHNRNARQLLVRDVDNLSAFLTRQDPRARRRPLGQQIWRAFEDNTLTPEFDPQRALRSAKPAGGGGARGETSRRTSPREADAPSAEASAPPRTPRRREVVVMSPAGGGPGDGGASKRRRRRKPRAGGAEASAPKPAQRHAPRAGEPRSGAPASSAAANGEGSPAKRRRRRRRKPASAPEATSPQSSAPQSSAPRSSAPQSSAPRSNAPKSNANRSKGRPAGEGRRADGAPVDAGPVDASRGDAPKKRRRRRRRRKPAEPS